MVFASADFSCFFVQIFFYAHVIGAKREYVALFFFVGQCFQLFGIGKTRNGIGHRFTVFLQFAKFEIYFFLFGRCSRGRNFLLVVVFAKSGFALLASCLTMQFLCFTLLIFCLLCLY